jgi:surfeit locus 1 family protein
MPHFKPLPILSLFTLISLAILVGLGNWQIQRMSWKTEMTHAYDTRGTATSFAEALCLPHDGYFGPSISAPAPLTGEEIRYYELREEGGWVRLSLIQAPICNPGDPQKYLFIESAFETLQGGTRTRPELWRIDPVPEPRGFGMTNNPDANEWYVFDRVEMAAAFDVDLDQVLNVWARSDLGMPASLSSVPPAKHMGYALTWYGLALALLAVYLALHITRGRLRWR